MKRRHAQTKWGLISLALMMLVTPLACSGGSDEGQSGEQGEGGGEVTRTIVANPEEMQQAFMRVADEVLPSVVEVNVLQIVDSRPQSLFEYFFGNPNQGDQRRSGLGSGVIVRSNGDTFYVVTNYHVVQDADQIGVVLHDEREFEASLVGGDERTDLALLEFTSSDGIPVIELGDSDDVRVGQWAIAVGNPYGFESSVTAGIISAVGRTAQPGTPIGGFTEYIQTDAAINPGNSGGALVDLDGRLVGVNAWIASQSGGSAGIGFAIPVNVVAGAIDDFIEEGRIIYGWLGVTVISPSSRALPGLASDLGIAEESGVLINNIHTGSPAVDEGLLPGDYVTAVNGEDVEDPTSFARQVGGNSPGTGIDFTVTRYGDEQRLSVTLEEQPSPEELNDPSNLWPGLDIIPITDEIRRQTDMPSSLDGVIAIRVIGDSPVATAGIQRGDVIVDINGNETPDARAFYRELNEAGGRVEFGINRGGREIGIRLSR
jgi:serine protease Do